MFCSYSESGRIPLVPGEHSSLLRKTRERSERERGLHRSNPNPVLLRDLAGNMLMKGKGAAPEHHGYCRSDVSKKNAGLWVSGTLPPIRGGILCCPSLPHFPPEIFSDFRLHVPGPGQPCAPVICPYHWLHFC